MAEALTCNYGLNAQSRTENDMVMGVCKGIQFYACVPGMLRRELYGLVGASP
jgi:hypothetical protein